MYDIKLGFAQSRSLSFFSVIPRIMFPAFDPWGIMIHAFIPKCREQASRLGARLP